MIGDVAGVWQIGTSSRARQSGLRHLEPGMQSQGATGGRQPSRKLRLILNAAALAAASPTLLLSDWYNAARLYRNESDWLRWHSSGSEVRLGLPVGL